MNRYPMVAAVAAATLALTGLAVAPQLSARLTGDEYEFRVEPVDPIDPGRGAYVQLGYPDLRHDDSLGEPGLGALDDGHRGRVYVTLREQNGVMVAADWTRDRPAEGPYLACTDSYWQIRCGIESWFVPQDEARDIQDLLGTTGAVATVSVDAWGNAAIVDLRAP